MSNQIVWVDIPVADLDRAIKFYSAVLDNEVVKQSFSGMSLGLLPHADTFFQPIPHSSVKAS